MCHVATNAQSKYESGKKLRNYFFKSLLQYEVCMFNFIRKLITQSQLAIFHRRLLLQFKTLCMKAYFLRAKRGGPIYIQRWNKRVQPWQN